MNWMPMKLDVYRWGAARLAILVAAMCVIGRVGHSAELTTTSDVARVEVELGFKPPASFYEYDGKTLSWREPKDNTAVYVQVLVRQAQGRQPLPGCAVTALLANPAGKAIGSTVTLHETWDGTGSHYGANVHLAEDVTSGRITVAIEPPKIRRMDREHGDFFTKPVLLKFEGVEFPQERAHKQADEPATTTPQTIDWPAGRRPFVEPTPYPGSK